MGAEQKTIYEQVAHSTAKHFGKEAPPHIDKLIDMHLSKLPQELTKEELISLIDWIRGMALFLEKDAKKVEKYLADLISLSAEYQSEKGE